MTHKSLFVRMTFYVPLRERERERERERVLFIFEGVSEQNLTQENLSGWLVVTNFNRK
jgi:hypothetical protein